jgi:CMP-N,N'-diacetyllegionaminic acid synthase
MTRVLGLIPARGGSKGVPGKNIRPLAGKPLIAWTIEAARAAKGIERLFCSTDDPRIAAVCEEYGLPVPFLRSTELAGDRSRVQDAALETIRRLGERFDYLLLLQPTAPFRSAGDIEAALALAETHKAASVASFCLEEGKHPYYMYRWHEGTPPRVEQLLSYPVGTPRQEFPPMAYRNGAVYLVRMEHFLARHSFVSDDMVPYLMPAERSGNVDTEEDFAYLEWRASRGGGN